MIPWLNSLRMELEAEYGARPRVLALATLDEDGAARVRHVICRRIDADGSLWMVSDARTEKNRHLRRHPDAESSFYLSTLRIQYRIRGPVKLLGAGDTSRERVDVWKSLSDASRAMFAWPESGTPFSAQSFPSGLGADALPPESFEVLIQQADRIERLDINAHPHARVCWLRSEQWKPARLNP